MKFLIKITLIIVFITQIQNTYSQKLHKSKGYYFKQLTGFANLGTDSSFVFFLTSKQSFHNYVLLMIDSNNLTLKTKKKISFESKKEVISSAVINKGRLFIETKIYIRNKGEIVNKYILNPYTFQKFDDNISVELDTLKNDNNTIIFHNHFHYNDYVIKSEIIGNHNYLFNDFKINYSVQDDINIYFYKRFLKNFEIINPINNKKKEILLKNRMNILKYNLFKDNDSNFRLVGIFNNEQEKSYGIFQMFLNFNLEETKKTSYLTLVNKNSLPENNINSEFLFNNISFKHYIKTSNDNHIFVFNKFITNWATSGQGATFQSGINFRVGDILILNFNKDGVIAVNKINLSQNTMSNKKSSSYLLKVTNNQITFVFYDHKKNNLNNNKQYLCEFTNSTVLMSCNYDVNLNKVSDKKIIANSKEVIFFIEFDDLYPIVNGGNVTYFYFGKRRILDKKCYLYKLQI